MTLIRNRKGFSLIELMIVIAIIGILVAVALPQFAAMTEDAKKTKAKQDADTICQAIQKYNSLEGIQVEKLMDLKGKYLTNIDTLRDPWGNAYQIDVYGGFVYSKGPDGQDRLKAAPDGTKYIDTDPTTGKVNTDNIKVSYIGALTIVKATLEVNPGGESDPTQAFDVLHLYFNKRVKIAKNIDLMDAYNTDPIAPAEAVASGKTGDDVTNTFRWCEGSKNKYVPSTTVFKTFDANGEPGAAPADVTAAAAAALWDGNASANTYYLTEDNREVIIAMTPGTSGSIIPGTHYINLTGNRKNEPQGGNPTFKEFNGVTGGEASGTPIQIVVHD